MPTAIQDFILESPGAGGANEKVSGSLIDNNQSARPNSSTLPLLNVHTNDIGDVVQRNGYTVYSGPLTTSTYITGLYQYRKLNGNKYDLACGDDGSTKHIWDISTPGSPSDIIGAATITSDSLYSFCVLADTLIITTDARNTPLKWTGSGNVASLGGSPPSGKYCIEFSNYAFIANTSANPERVYWSNLYTPETWTGTDFYRLSGECTGLGKSQDNLFLFTRKGIVLAKYTGDSLLPFSFDALDTEIGCSGPFSIVNALGTIFWVGNDAHIYKLNGFVPERVTEIIPTTISEINASALNRCVSVDHRELGQLWFFYPKDSGTTNNFVIAYDYLNNQIYFYDNIDANCVANFQSSSGSIKTYFGDRNSRVYLSNTGNTDYLAGTSTEISCYKYTKMFNLGNPGKAKRFRRVRATVNAQGSCLSTISLIGDFGRSGGETLSLNHTVNSTTIGSFIIGTSALGGTDRVSVDNDCATTARYLQMKLEHAQNNIPYSVRDIVTSFQDYQGGNR